jgi:hypothetical protein
MQSDNSGHALPSYQAVKGGVATLMETSSKGYDQRKS